MNKKRRASLDGIAMQINHLYYMLEEVKYEEEEAKDNMPESLWGSERYEAMEEAITNLEDAITSLEDAMESIVCACEV